MKKFPFLIYILYLFTSCSNYGQLTLLSKLPKKLDENSGMVSLQNNSVWMIEDTGNKNEIYHIDLKGNLLQKIKLKNTANKDWEALAKDKKQNVYIGDFGNNENKRKDLVIHKIPLSKHQNKNSINAEHIYFKYPEQTKFPPKKKKRLYDAEAMFIQHNTIYIITKNRTIPFTGETLIYKVPIIPGKYKAELVGTFITCKDSKVCKITDADISPDGTKIVLVSNGKLWVYNHFNEENFSKEKFHIINLGITTQIEAVCFLNNTTLLLSDEENKDTGRNLYSYTLK